MKGFGAALLVLLTAEPSRAFLPTRCHNSVVPQRSDAAAAAGVGVVVAAAAAKPLSDDAENVEQAYLDWCKKTGTEPDQPLFQLYLAVALKSGKKVQLDDILAEMIDDDEEDEEEVGEEEKDAAEEEESEVAEPESETEEEVIVEARQEENEEAPSEKAAKIAEKDKEDVIRNAYKDWCKLYKKEWDDSRFKTFSFNYKQVEVYSRKTGKAIKLTEYADHTPAEYQAIQKKLAEERGLHPSPDVAEPSFQARVKIRSGTESKTLRIPAADRGRMLVEPDNVELAFKNREEGDESEKSGEKTDNPDVKSSDAVDEPAAEAENEDDGNEKSVEISGEDTEEEGEEETNSEGELTEASNVDSVPESSSKKEEEASKDPENDVDNRPKLGIGTGVPVRVDVFGLDQTTPKTPASVPAKPVEAARSDTKVTGTGVPVRADNFSNTLTSPARPASNVSPEIKQRRQNAEKNRGIVSQGDRPEPNFSTRAEPASKVSPKVEQVRNAAEKPGVPTRADSFKNDLTDPASPASKVSEKIQALQKAVKNLGYAAKADNFKNELTSPPPTASQVSPKVEQVRIASEKAGITALSDQTEPSFSTRSQPVDIRTGSGGKQNRVMAPGNREEPNFSTRVPYGSVRVSGGTSVVEERGFNSSQKLEQIAADRERFVAEATAQRKAEEEEKVRIAADAKAADEKKRLADEADSMRKDVEEQQRLAAMAKSAEPAQQKGNHLKVKAHQEVETPEAHEYRLRTAYKNWCRYYGQVPTEAKYQVFANHYEQAAEYSQRTGILVQMDEYADLTVSEYNRRARVGVESDAKHKDQPYQRVLAVPGESKKNHFADNRAEPNFRTNTQASAMKVTGGTEAVMELKPNPASLEQLAAERERLVAAAKIKAVPANKSSPSDVPTEARTETPVAETVGKAAEQGSRVSESDLQRLRAAYKTWYQYYGKTASQRGFQTFSNHFLQTEQYCKQTGKSVMMDEYADLTVEEYKSQSRVGMQDGDLHKEEPYQRLVALPRSSAQSTKVVPATTFGKWVDPFQKKESPMNHGLPEKPNPTESSVRTKGAGANMDSTFEKWVDPFQKERSPMNQGLPAKPKPTESSVRTKGAGANIDSTFDKWVDPYDKDKSPMYTGLPELTKPNGQGAASTATTTAPAETKGSERSPTNQDKPTRPKTIESSVRTMGAGAKIDSTFDKWVDPYDKDKSPMYTGLPEQAKPGQVTAAIAETKEPPAAPQTELQRINAAYRKWCRYYGKTPHASNFQVFANHYRQAEQYAQKSGKAFLMDEFADLTLPQYKQRARIGEEQFQPYQRLLMAPGAGKSKPSFESAEPNFRTGVEASSVKISGGTEGVTKGKYTAEEDLQRIATEKARASQEADAARKQTQDATELDDKVKKLEKEKSELEAMISKLRAEKAADPYGKIAEQQAKASPSTEKREDEKS